MDLLSMDRSATRATARAAIIRDRTERRRAAVIAAESDEGGALVGLEASPKISALAVGILFFAPIGYGVWLAAKGQLLTGLAMATVGPFASLWAAGKIVDAVDA